MKTPTPSALTPLTFGLLSVLSVSVSAPGELSAASFDCARAQSSSAKLICSDPSLSALDEQLAQRYKALRAQLSKEGQSELKASQRLWLKYWPKLCAEQTNQEALSLAAAPCARGRYQARIKELSVQRFEGRPYFQPTLHRAAKTQAPWGDELIMVEQHLSSHRLLDGGLSGAEAELVQRLNQWLKPRADELAWLKNSEAFDMITELSSRESAQLGTKLWRLAVDTGWMGGAHPMSYSYHKWFHLKARRPLLASDLFVKPGWEEGLAKLAYESLKREIPEELYISGPDKLIELVREVKSWDIKAEGLGLYFNNYEVAAYVAGPQSTLIPWVKLKAYLRD